LVAPDLGRSFEHLAQRASLGEHAVEPSRADHPVAAGVLQPAEIAG